MGLNSNDQNQDKNHNGRRANQQRTESPLLNNLWVCLCKTIHCFVFYLFHPRLCYRFWNQDATTKQKREATGTDLVELAVRRAEDLGLHPYELQGRLHEVLDIQRVLNVMREGGKIADFDLLKEMFWESGSLEELQAFYKAKLEGLVKEGVQAVNLKRGRELLEEGKGMLAPLK